MGYGMSIGYELKACGREGLPSQITLRGQPYLLQKVFKHDFFAATALYISNNDLQLSGVAGASLPGKVVLKLNRPAPFLGLPLNWLGQTLNQHEYGNLRRLQTVKGVPRLLGRWGACGFLYEYIAGRTLDEKPDLPDDFFDLLQDLLRGIHARGMAYIDLNKRGNIILGDDSRPHLIDFQISWCGCFGLGGLDHLCQPLLSLLQREDWYHLAKHKRRFRSDLMTSDEIAASRHRSIWVSLYGALTRPLTRLRRAVLGTLYRKGHLATGDVTERHPETDPSRWAKSS